MIKTLSNETNMFLQIDRTEHASHAFHSLQKKGTYLSGNLQDPESFFDMLHAFSIKHKKAKRTVRRDIEAICVELMIPQDMTRTQLLNFSEAYALKAFQNLPYSAFFIKRGNGSYIHFLVSERRYMKKCQKVDIVAKSDVYQKVNETGRKVFTTASDPLATRIKEKGTVYGSYSTHFTNKERLFTGNDKEFSHKINVFMRIAISLLNKINFVAKRVFFRKINIKEAHGNYYHYLNIRDLNDTFMYFEKYLNQIEENLLLGYMEDELENLNKIKYTYLNRARKMRFRYGRVSLPFHFCVRRDIFIENLETFIENFDKDIHKFYTDLSAGLC